MGGRKGRGVKREGERKEEREEEREEEWCIADTHAVGLCSSL
jgi:hypothetical protein